MVRNQALVGESGNRKLHGRQAETGQWNDKHSYKKRIAVMSVSIPVMIMSLEEHKYGLRFERDTSMRYGLPLPRLKPSSMYMQRAKADETDDNLSYNLREHQQRVNGRGCEPVPFMRTTSGFR
jgi:hypothetical protein